MLPLLFPHHRSSGSLGVYVLSTGGSRVREWVEFHLLILVLLGRVFSPLHTWLWLFYGSGGGEAN